MLQLDSGTTVNNCENGEKSIGGERTNDHEKTTVTLVMSNQSEVKPLGRKLIKFIVNPDNKKKCSIEFPIVTRTCKFITWLEG